MNTGDLEAALTMVRSYEACFAGDDPYAPYAVSTDHNEQVQTFACYGCIATGEKRWSDQSFKIKHKADCKWLAWRRLVANERITDQ